MASELTLADLSEAINRVIDELRKRGIEIISIDEKGYLHINMSSALDVYGDPGLSLGDYDEDVAIIKNTLKCNDFVNYNYIQALASIIQYLGIKTLTEHDGQ